MAQTRYPAGRAQDRNLKPATGSVRVAAETPAVPRFSGAVLRAILVALVIATPALLLPGTIIDTVQIVALVCIISGVFAFVEYTCRSPSLIEFRDAPPFNRIRFFGLAATILSLTIITKGASEPNNLTIMFEKFGTSIAAATDLPFSPVRLMVLMFPSDSSSALIDSVRTAAGLSYLVSMLSLAFFVLVLRLNNWPCQNGGFNVWTNLPMFDPTAGGDVVVRLERDGQLNLILGFLLPFLIPMFVMLASNLFNPIQLQDPHTLIWTMTAWAFLPASLIMRGIAMLRVARMISVQRDRASSSAQEEDASQTL